MKTAFLGGLFLLVLFAVTIWDNFHDEYHDKKAYPHYRYVVPGLFKRHVYAISWASAEEASSLAHRAFGEVVLEDGYVEVRRGPFQRWVRYYPDVEEADAAAASAA